MSQIGLSKHKPEIHFLSNVYPIEVGKSAVVVGVYDHPDQFNVPSDSLYALTSPVVSYDEATGNFETLNSKYVRTVE